MSMYKGIFASSALLAVFANAIQLEENTATLAISDCSNDAAQTGCDTQLAAQQEDEEVDYGDEALNGLESDSDAADYAAEMQDEGGDDADDLPAAFDQEYVVTAANTGADQYGDQADYGEETGDQQMQDDEMMGNNSGGDSGSEYGSNDYDAEDEESW